MAKDLLGRASAQYETYVQLTELTTIESLAHEETWEHDPSAPLSVHLTLGR